MKKQLKSLLLVALFTCTTLTAWGQASTLGKEFWLAATIVCQPPEASSKPAVPYIAISTKEACVVSITDYQGNSVVTQHNTTTVLNQIPLGAGTWTEFGNTNATVQLYDIDPTKWYPTSNVKNAGDVYKHADEKNRYGLHVTSDKDISVFVVLRATNSMDASNILPVTAIQSEYYTQDYWPYAKSVSTNVTMATILAIEDNTIVDITPKGDTYGKSNSGQMFNITLNKGETYYLMSKSGEQLAGTHIKARNDKKIAVYNGCPLTTVPVLVSARDGMYEQSMPVDYWGTDFIVTRSKNKDGNIIGITASNDGTSVYIDGYYRTTIKNAGDTYYCMLQSTYDPNSKKPGDKPLNTSDVLTADAAYIYTSCPCAVYSYDTGNAFVYSKDENENLGSGDDRLGDPSSVWISPIQQTISEITFGTCYTNKTSMHYLNVVTETATCQQTTLAYRNGTSMVDCSNLLEWTEVAGNTKYSYARALISNGETSKNVFTLKNPVGFIAHIYGNGDDESYAYSAGASAVQQGVKVAGVTFPDGYRNETDKFCIGAELDFDASVGTDEITRVDWDFGDGITENNSTVQVSHKYTTPGWYDVKADLYGHQVCTDESELPLGSVTFSFRVARLDTIPGTVAPLICIEEDSVLNGQKLTAAEVADLLANGKNDTVPVGEPLIGGCYETVVVNYRPYGIVTREEPTTINLEIQPGEESVYCPELGEWFTASDEREKVTLNEYGCNNYHPYLIKVKACLYMDLEQDPKLLSACEGNALEISYKKRGDVEDAHLIIEPIGSGYRVNTGTNEAPVSPATEDMIVPNQVIDLTFSWADGIDDGIIYENNDGTGTLVLPTDTLKPGIYDLSLVLTDANKECGDKPSVISRHITVKYPESVVVQMFNNVLAVLNAQNNGGYEFVGFQWYRNGEPLTGETTAVYHTIAPLTAGDTYYVELTDAAGNKLPSCDFVIPANSGEYTTIQDETDDEPAAQKLIQNNRIVIRHDGQTYNIFGQKVR